MGALRSFVISVRSEPRRNGLLRFTGGALLIASIGLVGCSSSENSSESAALPFEPKLSVIEDRVFNKSCTFSSCHGSSTPKAGLSLVGPTFQALVNQPSSELPQRLRVVPGDPESSFLIDKLEHDQPSFGVRMPYQSPPLSASAVEVIRSWIEQGANDD